MAAAVALHVGVAATLHRVRRCLSSCSTGPTSGRSNASERRRDRSLHGQRPFLSRAKAPPVEHSVLASETTVTKAPAATTQRERPKPRQPKPTILCSRPRRHDATRTVDAQKPRLTPPKAPTTHTLTSPKARTPAMHCYPASHNPSTSSHQRNRRRHRSRTELSATRYAYYRRLSSAGLVCAKLVQAGSRSSLFTRQEGVSLLFDIHRDGSICQSPRLSTPQRIHLRSTPPPCGRVQRIDRLRSRCPQAITLPWSTPLNTGSPAPSRPFTANERLC